VTLFVLFIYFVLLDPEIKGPQSSTPEMYTQALFIMTNVKCGYCAVCA